MSALSDKRHRAWITLIGLLVVVMALAVPISVMAFNGNQTVKIKAKASNVAGASVKVVADGPDWTSLTGSIKFADAAGTKTTLPITFSAVGLIDPGSGLQQLVFLDAATAGGGISVGISPLAVPHPGIGVVPLLVGGGVGPPLAIFGPDTGDEVKIDLKSKLK